MLIHLTVLQPCKGMKIVVKFFILKIIYHFIFNKMGCLDSVSFLILEEALSVRLGSLGRANKLNQGTLMFLNAAFCCYFEF
jgi:hypothetical protein